MDDFCLEDLELKNILEQSPNKHDIRIRVPQVCELAAQRYNGDFCEIGVKAGGMTVLLAEIARKYSRRVVAVDPWQVGVEDCFSGEYETFLSVMSPYSDILEIIRGKSQDDGVISALRERTFAFVFIDAMHSGWAIRGDIEIFNNTDVGIIAVDDINTEWGDALDGFLQGAKTIGKTPVYNSIFREGYLI